ncbi:MAG TPA: glycoside hydrolase family 140 protein [Tepidisphaeraceae bacterium]|nr:glycoside hydrolase family 140 protein [Tepidisphaeraceae bacterium]
MITRALLVALMMGSTICAVAQPKGREGPSVDFKHGDLRVSDNKRFLVHADGAPFFYLGDTAWELFHRLTMEQAERYLENRRGYGYTAIQCVILPEFDGLKTPNRQGHLPLIDYDPAKPNEAYFKDVDAVLAMAERKGLYLALLPTWGDKVNKKWGQGPEIFTPENAKVYGAFLGRRYADRPNVIWILGGDRPVENDTHREIWRAMAAGIQSADKRHLVGYHPQGRAASSTFWPDEPWLAFHMIQSGHNGRDTANYESIAKDYARTPTKPVFDGEPRYEDHPVRGSKLPKDYFNDFDVRQAAYWAVFAGGFGHTYGSHSIWSMHSPETPAPGKLAAEMLFTWDKAIDRPGSAQMAHLRRLMESRPFLSRIPDQSLIVGENPKGAGHRVATRGDGYAMVYVPDGGKVTLELKGANLGPKVRAWLFDPRDGSAKELETFEAAERKEFVLPGEVGRGNDWVIVLDDSGKGLGIPGSVK